MFREKLNNLAKEINWANIGEASNSLTLITWNIFKYFMLFVFTESLAFLTGALLVLVANPTEEQKVFLLTAFISWWLYLSIFKVNDNIHLPILFNFCYVLIAFTLGTLVASRLFLPFAIKFFGTSFV